MTPSLPRTCGPTTLSSTSSSTRAIRPRAITRPLPSTALVAPTGRHRTILRDLIEAAGPAANLTTDAHLAALAIQHGATLATFDGDFHRFNGLKLEYLG